MTSLSMHSNRSVVCNNVFNYVVQRQAHSVIRLSDSARERCIAQHLPTAIKEHELFFGNVDKIFAAQWLDENHIICGTKCNKV